MTLTIQQIKTLLAGNDIILDDVSYKMISIRQLLDAGKCEIAFADVYKFRVFIVSYDENSSDEIFPYYKGKLAADDGYMRDIRK